MREKIGNTETIRATGGLNIGLFRDTIALIKDSQKEIRKDEISKLLQLEGLITHYEHKSTKRKLLADFQKFDYPHERHTSIKLTAVDYDVLFVPKGFFKRDDKKFDVFLTRGHILFESDLKCISSTNPDTIGKRIKEGSQQAKKLVLDIHADIRKPQLIDGLRLGCQRNEELNEILLFYKSRFYRLEKSKILSCKLFDTL